jgi:hypothetical protein
MLQLAATEAQINGAAQANTNLKIGLRGLHNYYF